MSASKRDLKSAGFALRPAKKSRVQYGGIDSNRNSNARLEAERDWVIDPDYYPMDDEEESDDGSDDESEAASVVSTEAPTEGIVPKTQNCPIDDRCGTPNFNIALDDTERKQRIDRFDSNVGLLVQALKQLAVERGPNNSELLVMTQGFYSLLVRLEQEYLVDLFLQGVLELTKLVLGKKGFHYR